MQEGRLLSATADSAGGLLTFKSDTQQFDTLPEALPSDVMASRNQQLAAS